MNKFILFAKKVMQGLRNKYPAFNTCKRKAKHSKIESVSISRNQSTTKFDAPLIEEKVEIVLQNNYKMIIVITIIIDPVVIKTSNILFQKRGIFERSRKLKTKKNKVKKSESFMTEKTMYTDFHHSISKENVGLCR